MAKEGRFGVLHVVERCLALDHLQGGGVDGPAQGGAIAAALVLGDYLCHFVGSVDGVLAVLLQGGFCGLEGGSKALAVGR